MRAFNFLSARRGVFAVWLSIFVAAGCASAAEVTGAELLAGKQGQWVKISDGLLADFARRDIKPIIKFKYDSTNGAGVCGILADRSLSNPLVIIQGQGIWQAGATGAFQRIDGGAYDAFYENAGPDIDPAGTGICLFSIQGSTTNSSSAITHGGKSTWRALTTDQQAFGYDVGAVDWQDTGGMTLLAKKHHNGDLVLSRDGGKTWTLLGKGEARVAMLGLIGKEVLLKGVRGQDGAGSLFRSTDAGTNWVKVAECEFGRIGHAVVFKGTAYVTTMTGILTSADKGEHWALTGAEQTGLLGPVMFGADEKHLMVYGRRGFFESKDAGKTWTLAAPFGDDAVMRSGRFEYGSWDPKMDCFYLTHISGMAYVYKR